MAEDILKQTRRNLKDSGRSKGETSSEYLGAIQELRKEMNAAKVAAMAEAEKPFLERIRELEEDYAIYLQLAS
jgi:hypothetical protein